MIVKNLDNHTPGDKREEAGRAAEERMAKYLAREFGSARTVAVVNDLRLVLSNQQGAPVDWAQIDHLILHPGGAIVIESKSVTGHLICDDQGQWLRHSQQHEHGMQSPIAQAEAQGKFLRHYMRVAWPDLTTAWHGSILVAVSDQGHVRYTGTGPTIEQAKRAVFKADRIADRVRYFIARTPPLPSSNWKPVDIAGQLASHHRPWQQNVQARQAQAISRLMTRELQHLVRELTGGWNGGLF